MPIIWLSSNLEWLELVLDAVQIEDGSIKMSDLSQELKDRLGTAQMEIVDTNDPMTLVTS